MPDDPLAPQTPPPQPPTALDTPLVAGPTSTGMAPNVAAGLSVVFGLISGIVFLVLEKRSAFVRFWAMQATIFGLVGVAQYVVIRVLVAIFSGSTLLLGLVGLLSLLFSLVLLIVWVIMLIKSFGGTEWEVPFIGKIARQQLVKFPPKS